MTTFEEAKKCPKCGQPGRDGGTKPTQRKGAVIHLIYCENQLCRWGGEEPWLVQVNEDGSIPEPGSRLHRKQFKKVSQETESKINEAIARQLEAERSGLGEIRNPYA